MSARIVRARKSAPGPEDRREAGRDDPMTIRRLVAVMVAMLFAAPAYVQSPGNAVWGVNDQNQVFRFDPASRAFEPVPGSLKHVSVGADGQVWGVDPDDNIHRWNGTQWQPVPGKLRQLSVRNAQEVWGVNAANDLFRWNGSTWEQIPGKFKRVSVGADGTVWAINADGDVLRRDGSTWTTIPGKKLEKISVTDAQRVWGIDADENFFRWTGTDWQSNVDKLLDIVQATNGEIWELAFNGTIHFNQGSPGAPTQRMDYHRLLKQIAVGSAGGAVTPPPTPPPAGTEPSVAEQQQALEAHNRERQNYPGVGPLQLSPELAQYAQEWAQTLANRDINWGDHRPNNARDNPFRPGEALGENISWGSSVGGAGAVQGWINEKQWYNYDTGCSAPSGKSCGHFTQVIWKASQFVGCGKAKGASGTIYFVCNYYPAGNWGGQKPY
jgi:virginiamycin B lyase